MASITQGMDRQYADSDKLAARAKLHGFGRAEVPWFTWVAQHVSLPLQGGSVLDVGCGPAWFWPEALQVLTGDIHLTLFDQSPGMIEQSLDRCRLLPLTSIEGRVGDATELPFGDASFDTVIAMHMLYHVADQERAIAEFRRVLKPGGSLVVTTNGVDNMQELYRLTTIFGSAPIDPSAVAFDIERARTLMGSCFGNVEFDIHPDQMRITDAETVFRALTSYPPGETAAVEQQQAFRHSIDAAFSAGSGGIDVTKQVAVLVSRKPD